MSEQKLVTKKQAEVPKRKERVPLTGLRPKLTVEGEEPGFHYAWIHEENADAALDAYYEFVTHEVKVGGQHIDVGTIPGAKVARAGGQGTTLYLMRVPVEFYEEDQAAIQKDVDESEERLFVDTNSNGLSGTLQIGKRDFSKKT